MQLATVVFKQLLKFILVCLLNCKYSYHIKYSYMGDMNREEIEKIVSKLQLTLQTRLRFLATGSSDHPSTVHLSTSMNLVAQQQNINV